MRLIDGSFLEDRCKRQMNDEWNKKAAPSSWAAAYEQFLTDIENCPTVDAVPVVRCKDCKHTKTDGMADPAIYCKKWDRWEMPSDFYCKYGERKGGDE